MSGTERNSIADGTGLTLNLVVEQESHEGGGMEGEGACTADSGSGETGVDDVERNGRSGRRSFERRVSRARESQESSLKRGVVSREDYSLKRGL